MSGVLTYTIVMMRHGNWEFAHVPRVRWMTWQIDPKAATAFTDRARAVEMANKITTVWGLDVEVWRDWGTPTACRVAALYKEPSRL